MFREHNDDDFLCGLEEALRGQLVEINVTHFDYVLSLPVSEWLFDPTEAGPLTVRVRILLGAVEALRSWHPPVTPSSAPLSARLRPLQPQG